MAPHIRSWIWPCLILWFFTLNVGLMMPLIPNYLSYDLQRLIEAALLGVATLSLILSPSLQRNWLTQFFNLPKLAQILWVLFFGIGILSASVSALPQYSLMLVGWYFLLFTSAITWSTLRQELGHKFDLMMLITLCVSVGCYCIFALYTYVFAVTGFYLYHQAIYLQFLAAPSFVNPRFLMQFIGLSLPFTVLPLLLYRKQLSYWAYPWALLCAYFWCLGFANQSRTIYFEVIVIPLILLALFGKKALPWLKIQGLLAIFGFILYLLLFKAIIYFAGRFDSAHFFAQFSSNNGRFLLWGTAFLLWKSHPLLGVGPLHYSYYAFNYEHIAAHPHNNFILIACEWGSIAVLALLSLSLWGVWRWCQKARLWQEEKTQLFVVALTASLFIGMLDGLFSGNIVMPLSQITLVLILAWLFGVYCATNIPTTIAPTRFKHWILLAALLIAGIWVVRGMAPILPLLTKEYLVALGNCQGGVCLLNPSFWTQGWIQYYPH